MNVHLIVQDDLVILHGKENEDNWEQRDRIILELADLVKQDPDYTYTSLIKPNIDSILGQLCTPRTQLVLSAFSLIGLIVGKNDLDELAIPPLVKCSGSTKKILSQEAGRILKILATKTAIPLRCLSLFSYEVCNEKNVTIRARVIDAILMLLLRNHATIMNDSKATKQLGAALRKTIGDASPEVRYLAAQCFMLLESFYNQFAASLYQELDASSKKQLNMSLGKLEKDDSAPLQQYFLSLTEPNSDNNKAGNDVVSDRHYEEQKDILFNDADQTKLQIADPVPPTKEIKVAPLTQVVEAEIQVQDEDNEIIINVHHKELSRDKSDQQCLPQERPGHAEVEHEDLEIQQIEGSPEESTENAQDELEEIHQSRIEESDEEGQCVNENLMVESILDTAAPALVEADPTPNILEYDNVIPEFVSMDIEISPFETKLQILADSFEPENITINLSYDEHRTPMKSDLYCQPLERLDLAMSVPYRTSGIFHLYQQIVLQLNTPRTPKVQWHDKIPDHIEAIIHPETCTLQTFEKVASLLKSPNIWDAESFSQLIYALNICVTFSLETKLLVKTVVERIKEYWEAYRNWVDVVVLIGLLEELHMDLSWTADVMTAQSAVALLVDNVTPARLQLMKRSVSVDAEIPKAIMPLLKHLLDNPNVTIRRLAMECIADIDSSIMSLYSPLSFRYKHVIQSMLDEQQ